MDWAATRRRVLGHGRWVVAEYSVALTLLLAATLLGWSGGIRFVAGAVLVGAGLLAAYLALETRRPVAAATTTRWHLLLLGAIVLAAWALRMLAHMGTDVPLGYDYGFYKATFDAYAAGPVDGHPDWMAKQFPPGLPMLHAVMDGAAGLGSLAHLSLLFPILAALVPVPVFAAVRTRFGPDAGLFAAALMGLGATQFAAYEYLYEKNILAIAMAFVVVLLLERQRPIAAGAVLGGVAIWHRPTLLWLGLGLAVVAVMDVARGRPWQRWARVGLGVAPVMLPAWLLMAGTFLGQGRDFVGSTRQAFAGTITPGTGTFFDLATYAILAAAYIPLALASLGRIRRGPASLMGLGAVAGGWVVLSLPFHQRFLIMADAAAVALAAAALWSIALHVDMRRAVAVVVVALVLVPTVLEAQDPDPSYRFVTDAEWQRIQWMQDGLPEGAVVVASNLQAPYVLADSGHATVGPGLFGDPATRADWDRAMRTPTTLAVFLDGYGDDVYVFQGHGPGPDFMQGLLREPYFQPFNATRAATIWHVEAP